MIRKAEYMIPYHMARCPNYGWKESPEYAEAEKLFYMRLQAYGIPRDAKCSR